jgi:hypothetical protein
MSCYNRDHPSRKSYGITQVVRHRRPSEAGIDLPRPLPHHRRPSSGTDRHKPHTGARPVPYDATSRTAADTRPQPHTDAVATPSRQPRPPQNTVASAGFRERPGRSDSPRHNSPPRPALAGDPPLVKHACGCTTEWILGHGWCRDRANARIRVAHEVGHSLCDQTLTRSSAWMTGRCIVSGSSAVERPSMPASSVLSYSTTPRATIRLSGATRSTTSPP